MTNSNHPHAALLASDADLEHAIAQLSSELDRHHLRSSSLSQIMRETFRGSDASGAWDWRMAYDVMQAVNRPGFRRG